MKKPVLDNRQKKITAISFGVFSDQQVKNLSVVELHERNIYDISGASRVPAKFGVLDNKLGPTAKGTNCETCGEPHQKCVGHFGISRLIPRCCSAYSACFSRWLFQADDHRSPEHLQDMFACASGRGNLQSLSKPHSKSKHG